MKIAYLLYGYSESMKNYDLFKVGISNFKKSIKNFDAHCLIHAWDNDPFLEEYIANINPRKYIVSSQKESDYIPNSLITQKGHRADRYVIKPRLFALQQLFTLLRQDVYDIVVLRRLDLIHHNSLNLNLLNINKTNVIRDYSTKHNCFQDEISKEGWGKERINDYLLVLNYDNMIRFLDFQINDIIQYFSGLFQSLNKQYHSKLIRDFHFFFTQRLKDLSLFDSINYAWVNPHDIEIVRNYFWRHGAINHNQGKWYINNHERFKELINVL